MNGNGTFLFAHAMRWAVTQVGSEGKAIIHIRGHCFCNLAIFHVQLVALGIFSHFSLRRVAQCTIGGVPIVFDRSQECLRDSRVFLIRPEGFALIG
jgi:hypothetical protein